MGAPTTCNARHCISRFGNAALAFRTNSAPGKPFLARSFSREALYGCFGTKVCTGRPRHAFVWVFGLDNALFVNRCNAFAAFATQSKFNGLFPDDAHCMSPSWIIIHLGCSKPSCGQVPINHISHVRARHAEHAEHEAVHPMLSLDQHIDIHLGHPNTMPVH